MNAIDLLALLAAATGITLGAWALHVAIRGPRHRHTWSKWEEVGVISEFGETTMQNRRCTTCGRYQRKGLGRW